MSSASTVWAEALWLLLLAVAAGICCVWFIERKHTYLIFIALSPTSIALGMLARLAPIDVAYRVAISGAFVVLGMYLGLEGLVRRTGRGRGPYFAEATAILGVTAVFVLAVTHRSLVWEVRIQDYSAAIIGVSAMCRGRFFTNGRRGDRFIGAEILGLVAYFLIRSWVGLDVAALSTTERSGFDAFTPPLVIVFVLLAAFIGGTITAQELATLVETLRRERDTDVLTGVFNRRGFQTRVERLLAARDHIASSLVVCDLDNFKPINDRYGHIGGDEVLRDLGEVLRDSVRPSDVLGRIGGDEFAVYLTGLDQSAAAEFAERIRRQLSSTQFRALADTESITACFGVAATAAGMEFTELLRAADSQLYQAKEDRKVGEDQRRPPIDGVSRDRMPPRVAPRRKVMRSRPDRPHGVRH
jgi:diguanylate cyclase (GGDEF)-like protein